MRVSSLDLLYSLYSLETSPITVRETRIPPT